ncbi:MAG: SirA family protein, partial [Desulfobacterales bacterium]
MKKIDTSGLSCPAPVLLVKDTLEQEQLTNIQVVIDNEASRENVTRFLGTKGFSVTTQTQGKSFILTAARNENAAAGQEVPAHAQTMEEPGKIVVLIMTDIMGQGDTELGRKLMTNYIK